MKLGGIYISVGAKTAKLKRDLAKAEGMTKKTAVLMRQEIGRISFAQVGIATAAFALGIAVLGKKVVTLGREFESTMKTVQAWSGATGENLKKLTDIARIMGATTEHTATEAAGALKYLAAAGFSAKKSIAALPGTLNLATAGQVALAEATDITTDVLTAFGLQVEELSRVNDAFITTSSSSNTNVLMLGQSMKMVAPTAKLFGLTVEQTAAFLGTLANAGVKAEMAGSGLNMVLLKSARAAKKLGLEAGTPLIKVLKKMKEAQWGAVEIGEAFGARQVKTAAILMDGIKNYEKLTQKILDNVGATSKLADVIRDSLDVDLKTLNSTIEEELLRTFDKYKKEIREIVQAATEWIRQNPALIDQIGDMAMKMLDLGVAVGKLLAYAAAYPSAWIDVWRALGLYSAGIIDLTTATQDSTHALKIFNEEMGPEKLRLAYLERIVASGKYTWQVEKEIRVLKALIESRKTLAALKAPSRLDEALANADKYYGTLIDVDKQLSKIDEKTKEYYKQLELLAKEKRDAILEFEDEETRMIKENLAYRLTMQEKYYKSIEAEAQEIRYFEEEMEDEKLRMARETAEYQKGILNEVQEYWKHTFENIHDSTADTFYDIFKDVEDGFRGLIENIKNWFLRLLAEMAAMAIANPIKIIIGTVGGALGLPGMAGAGDGLSGSIGTTITKWINQSPFGGTGALTEWGTTWGNMLSYAGIAFNTINAINALSEGNYGTAAGTGIGTIAGALLGGPLGAAIGGSIGSFIGGIVDNIFGGSNAGFGSLGGMDKSGKWGEIPSFGDWTQMPRAGGSAPAELIEGFEKAIQDTLQGMYDAIGAFSERMPDAIREKFEAALTNIELWYLPPLEGLTAAVGEKLTFALTREQAGNLEEYVKSIPAFILDQIAPALQDAISEWAGTFDLTLLTEDNPLKKLYDEILEGVQDGDWESYFEKVDAFMNTMGAVEEIWASLNETIDNALNPLSKFETVLLDVNTQFDYWIDTLEQLGFTVEAIAQIEADRILILQKLIEQEIKRQSKERQSIISEHELTDYQRQIQAIEQWRDAQLAAWNELEDYMDSIEYLQGIADILKAFDYLLENIEDRITRTIVKIESDLNRRLAQLTMSPEEYQKYMVELQYQTTLAQLVALEEETGRDLSDLIDLARQLRDVELETLEEQKKALEEQKKAAEIAAEMAERQREYARWDAANALYFTVLAEAADTTEARRSLRAIDDKYQNVIDRFADLEIYLWDYISHVWTEEERKVLEALELIRDREIEDLRQSILDSQQRLIDMWGDAAQQIENQINDMKLTSASPEDAQQRMALLKTQIQTMTGGDLAAYIASFETPEEKIAAMNKIREMWAEYLKMAQGVYQRPSDEYQAIYDEVLRQLELMKDIAIGYQSQEQLLMDQLIMLTDIRDLIAAFEGLGSYQSGTDYIPKTGLYELHVGEQVIPVNQRNYDGPQVSFTVNVAGSGKPKETAREVRKEMENFMISGIGRKLVQNTARGH